MPSSDANVDDVDGIGVVVIGVCFVVVNKLSLSLFVTFSTITGFFVSLTSLGNTIGGLCVEINTDSVVTNGFVVVVVTSTIFVVIDGCCLFESDVVIKLSLVD